MLEHCPSTSKFRYSAFTILISLKLTLVLHLMNHLLFILATLTYTDAYRILGICPTPAKSHQMVFHSLMRALANEGHELVLLTTDPMQTDNPNITQIDWSFSYLSDFSNANWVKLGSLGIIKMGLHDIPHILDESLSHPDVARMIKNYKTEYFDAVVVEHLGYTPMYAFAELFNAPLIGFTSLEMDANQHEALGNGAHPVVHSANMLAFYEGNTFYKRLWNTLAYITGAALYEIFDKMFENLIHKHFGSRIKSASVELAKRADIVLLNSSPFLGFVRPTVPNVIPVGFMHIEPFQRALPLHLKEFLDNADNGVIYFSFGTMVKSHHLKQDTVQTFMQAFKGLKYKVLWKSNIIVNANVTDKIYISTWFPQQDVLAHKNVKLFITQGGLPSLQESVYNGVPMIVIPYFYDQFDNAAIVEQKKIGKTLSHHSLSIQLLQKTIRAVIENPIYKQNVVELSHVVKDEPVTPRQKAVWWIEYTIRNKHVMKHFKYKGVELPFYQRYFIDVGVVLIVLIVILMYLTSKCLTKIRKTFACIRIRIKVKTT